MSGVAAGEDTREDSDPSQHVPSMLTAGQGDREWTLARVPDEPWGVVNTRGMAEEMRAEGYEVVSVVPKGSEYARAAAFLRRERSIHLTPMFEQAAAALEREFLSPEAAAPSGTEKPEMTREPR